GLPLSGASRPPVAPTRWCPCLIGLLQSPQYQEISMVAISGMLIYAYNSVPFYARVLVARYMFTSRNLPYNSNREYCVGNGLTFWNSRRVRADLWHKAHRPDWACPCPQQRSVPRALLRDL